MWVCPLIKENNAYIAAADGQMGTIMKVYREWQLSGNDDFLSDLVSSVLKRLCPLHWIEKGWDANKDGVMEGCQHNTMDIEYYGPNPEIGFWYLGALKAAAAMATLHGRFEFEKTCTALFINGSKWIDANIFNGEFYYQKIWPVKKQERCSKGLEFRNGSNRRFQP